MEEALARNFGESRELWVTQDRQSLPLVAANLRKNMKSFSKGQKVFAYDVLWGMNTKMQIVARYRRKGEFRNSIIPIENAEHFRFEIVYDPRVIGKLIGQKVDREIFSRLLYPATASTTERGLLKKLLFFWCRSPT
jgi:hypothetical protein